MRAKDETSREGEKELQNSPDVSYVVVRMKEGIPTITIEEGQIFDREKLKESIEVVLNQYEFPSAKQRADFMQLYCSVFGFSTEEINPLLVNSKEDMIEALSELADRTDLSLGKKNGSTVHDIAEVAQGKSLKAPALKDKKPKYSLFLDGKAAKDDISFSQGADAPGEDSSECEDDDESDTGAI